MDYALKNGCQQAKVNLYAGSNSSFELRDAKMDRLQQASENGLTIFLYVNGRYGTYSTNRLDKKELETFIKNGIDSTRYLAKDEARVLPDASRYYKGGSPDLKLLDAKFSSIRPDDKVALAKAVAEEALGRDDRIISVSSSYSDGDNFGYRITSNGFEGETKSSWYSLYAEVAIKGEGEARPSAGWYESSLYFDKIRFAYFDCLILQRAEAEKDYTVNELKQMYELDKVITDAEKEELVDTIIIKTQGFVNGNIKNGDKNPVDTFHHLLAPYKGIDRDALRENLRYFLQAIMPVCDEYGINMCIHPDDPPFPVLGLPRIVTCEEDIAWILHAVNNPHNGLTFCAGSLSAGLHNNVPALARMFAHRTHFVHLRSTNAFPNGNFIEASHLGGRAHIIELIRIFEKERPGVPMRVDHGRMMLGDTDKGYNPGYSFHGRMMALAQIEGMMAVVNDESKLES